MQAEIDFLKIQFLSRDQILTEARDLYTRWPDMTQEQKREIIETITERIVIHQYEVEINLCYLPSPPELMATEPRATAGARYTKEPQSLNKPYWGQTT